MNSKWKLQVQLVNFFLMIQEIRKIISADDVTGKRLRIKAFERATKKLHSKIETATITVAEGQQLELPCVEALSGITSMHIIQKPYSKLKFSFLQNLAPQENSFISIVFDLEDSAELECTTGTFGGSENTLVINTNMIGNGAQLRQQNIFLGSERQHFEIFSTTHMKGLDGKAKITAQGALQDNSHGRFDGGIIIEKSGKGCDGQLIEKALMLSSTCKMDAIPRLKIDTNDVTAGHSASMSRIDEEQLFYAASRGMSEPDAIYMIASGFMADAYANTTFADIAREIIENKLSPS